MNILKISDNFFHEFPHFEIMKHNYKNNKNNKDIMRQSYLKNNSQIYNVIQKPIGNTNSNLSLNISKHNSLRSFIINDEKSSNQNISEDRNQLNEF